jgi:hypothetical protein
MSTILSPRAEIAARVRAEGPVSLDQACILIPARNPRGHASPATLLRWIISGKGGVKLEGARVKGHWHTSLAALQRFRSAAGV